LGVTHLKNDLRCDPIFWAHNDADAQTESEGHGQSLSTECSVDGRQASAGSGPVIGPARKVRAVPYPTVPIRD